MGDLLGWLRGQEGPAGDLDMVLSIVPEGVSFPTVSPEFTFLRRHPIFCGLLLHHYRSNFAKRTSSLPRHLCMSMHTDHSSPKQWGIPLVHCCRLLHWSRQLVLLERLRIRRGEIQLSIVGLAAPQFLISSQSLTLIKKEAPRKNPTEARRWTASILSQMLTIADNHTITTYVSKEHLFWQRRTPRGRASGYSPSTSSSYFHSISISEASSTHKYVPALRQDAHTRCTHCQVSYRQPTVPPRTRQTIM
uniref:WGS project CBMI000000000 data, contig CS3069_c001621 n=1 Tax=Fusarium clavum TaxID=2594811 RepID=A0A090N5I7_9HYPO|nr:unnamed protein product [Fusarium clavum]